MFAIFQQKNKRQSAVSLLHFTLIRYSQLRATKKYRFQLNLPRLTNRANILMSLLRLMRSRATELLTVGDDEVYHIVRLHRERRFTRSWRLKLLVRPTRSGSPNPQVDTIKSKGRSPFFLLLTLIESESPLGEVS